MTKQEIIATVKQMPVQELNEFRVELAKAFGRPIPWISDRPNPYELKMEWLHSRAVDVP